MHGPVTMATADNSKPNKRKRTSENGNMSDIVCAEVKQPRLSGVSTNGGGAVDPYQRAAGPEPVNGAYSAPYGICTCGAGHGLHMCRACARRPFEEGERVVVQESYNKLKQIVLRKGGIMDSKYGNYRHDDLIGGSAGTRWEAVNHERSGAASCAGFMHALRLGPVLYGTSVAHRTQIVHYHDAALIIGALRLSSGCTVVEAGVGSGALSAALAWTVTPGGRVHGYEFHRERAAAARETLPDYLGVSVRDGDVCETGFPGVSDKAADAVFLDLPAPERVVQEAARVLRDDGRLCTFSPCIEQVQRTHTALRSSRAFHSVICVTAPVRTYETRPAGRLETEQAAAEAARHRGRILRPSRSLRSRPFRDMKAHTSFLTFATRVVRGTEAEIKETVEVRDSASCSLQ